MVASALIIEDNLRDARSATEVLNQVGAERVELISAFGAACLAFETICNGARSAPELVILDLDFGVDSGFELLRLWKSHRPQFQATRVVVWTIMPELDRKIAQLFGVEVVSKHCGSSELRRVLSLASPVT
jgi:CheY-like chemotaxis protein